METITQLMLFWVWIHQRVHLLSTVAEGNWITYVRHLVQDLSSKESSIHAPIFLSLSFTSGSPYKFENWGSEMGSDWPKVTRRIGQDQFLCSRPNYLIPYSPLPTVHCLPWSWGGSLNFCSWVLLSLICFSVSQVSDLCPLPSLSIW